VNLIRRIMFSFVQTVANVHAIYYYYSNYYYKCHGLECCHHTVAGTLYKNLGIKLLHSSMQTSADHRSRRRQRRIILSCSTDASSLNEVCPTSGQSCMLNRIQIILIFHRTGSKQTSLIVGRWTKEGRNKKYVLSNSGVCPMQLFHFWSRDGHPVKNLLLCTKFHENRMIRNGTQGLFGMMPSEWILTGDSWLRCTAYEIYAYVALRYHLLAQSMSQELHPTLFLIK